MKWIFKTLFSVVILSGMQCQEEASNPSIVNLSYEVLDKKGIPSHEFIEGENFIISFKIFNSSEEVLYYKRNHESNQNFAMVFRNSGAEGKIEIMKPFTSQYPPVTRQGFHIIEPNSFTVYSFPWIYYEDLYHVPSGGNYDNLSGEYPYNKSPLPPGIYEISFTDTFVFSDDNGQRIEIEELNLSYTFRIK